MANGITNIGGGKALSGTAQPSDVRLGMTYADGKELREGTLDLRNLKAENVKKDVNIAGVVGSFGGGIELYKETVFLPRQTFTVAPNRITAVLQIPPNTIAVSFRDGTDPSRGASIYPSEYCIITDFQQVKYEKVEGYSGGISGMNLVYSEINLPSAFSNDTPNISSQRTLYIKSYSSSASASLGIYGPNGVRAVFIRFRIKN